MSDAKTTKSGPRDEPAQIGGGSGPLLKPCLVHIDGDAPKRLMLRHLMTEVDGVRLVRAESPGGETVSVEMGQSDTLVTLEGHAISDRTPLSHGQQLSIGGRIFTYLAKGTLAAMLERKDLAKAAIREDTGCLKLNVLKDYLEDALDDVRETGGQVCLLVFGIDDLDGLVEQAGEANRNPLIEHIVDIVHRAVRGSDRVFQCGPNKFCLALPGASAESLYGLGDRVRARVDEAPLVSGDDPQSATVSVVIVTGPAAKDETPGTFIKRAMEKLVFALENGENQVLV